MCHLSTPGALWGSFFLYTGISPFPKSKQDSLKVSRIRSFCYVSEIFLKEHLKWEMLILNKFWEKWIFGGENHIGSAGQHSRLCKHVHTKSVTSVCPHECLHRCITILNQSLATQKITLPPKYRGTILLLCEGRAKYFSKMSAHFKQNHRRNKRTLEDI